MLMYQVWAGAIHFQAAFICLYRHIRQWICAKAVILRCSFNDHPSFLPLKLAGYVIGP